MPITDRFLRLPLDQIDAQRDSRQRREIEVSDLIASIKLRGVIQPIIVESEGPPHRLVAGERRLEASRQIGLLDIPARFASDLDPTERQIIELEENIKRKDLSWQDLVDAVSRIHLLYLDLDPEWTQGETAQSIGLSIGTVSMYLKVNGDMLAPRIASAGTVREAYNTLTRRDQRQMGNDLQELIGHVEDILPSPGPSGQDSGEGEGNAGHLGEDGRVIAAEAPKAILCQSFLDWAPGYAGAKFNLIHCDFPYGVDLFSAKDTRQIKKDETYADGESDYFTLLQCLCEHLDKFMSLSGHLMFWYSAKHHVKTIEIFNSLAPSLEVQTHPLIWVKSDNAGLVVDVRRQPRHIYETCLLASRGDRHLVQPKADAYSSPTDKALHPSTKPEPMLRHFMSMLVDENSTLFDPSCGSGSALRAAESLGATRVLGLEVNQQYADLANTALVNARKLRNASEVLS